MRISLELFHALVFVTIAVFVYRRSNEFCRLKWIIKRKDEVIDRHLKIIKKLGTSRFIIRDGDVYFNNVDQRTMVPDKKGIFLRKYLLNNDLHIRKLNTKTKTMKNLLLLIVTLVFLFGCHQDKIDSGEKLFNEVKNAEEIFGIFDLKLGTTTFKDLEKHYYKSPDYIYGKLEPDYHLGVYLLDINDYDERRIPEKNLISNKRVKQYYFSDYLYNGLSISGVSVFLLDDTLVGIHINFPHVSKGFNFVEDFKKKYGEGVGKDSWYYVYKWNPKIGDYSTDMNRSFSRSERSWKNSKIEVKYDGNDFKYTWTDGYQQFDSLMKEAIKVEMKKYNDSKNKEVKSAI